MVLVVGLPITPPFPAPGQWVNARFTVRNVGGQTFYTRYLGVAGQGPGGLNADFQWLENFTLWPESFTYDVNRTLDWAGHYEFVPQYSPDGRTWVDLSREDGGTSRATVEVASLAPPQPPSSTSICAYTQTNCYPYGECTWYTWERRKDLPCFPGSAGHVANWADSAPAVWVSGGRQPVPRRHRRLSAGSAGRSFRLRPRCVVEQVYANGWYRVSEYNFRCPRCPGTRDVPQIPPLLLATG